MKLGVMSFNTEYTIRADELARAAGMLTLVHGEPNFVEVVGNLVNENISKVGVCGNNSEVVDIGS